MDELLHIPFSVAVLNTVRVGTARAGPTGSTRGVRVLGHRGRGVLPASDTPEAAVSGGDTARATPVPPGPSQGSSEGSGAKHAGRGVRTALRNAPRTGEQNSAGTRGGCGEPPKRSKKASGEKILVNGSTWGDIGGRRSARECWQGDVGRGLAHGWGWMGGWKIGRAYV